VNAAVALAGVVTFFGGMAVGFRAGDWLVGRLLGDEPWLNRVEFRGACPRRAWWRHWLFPWQATCALTGFVLTCVLLRHAIWVMTFGGLLVALWMELMPWAVALGVWVEPMTKRVGGPLRVIASGPVRRVGLAGLGLTFGATLGAVALRAAAG
jgi:hypothetical protein